jgi:polyisoprenoid-binding protein YceI
MMSNLPAPGVYDVDSVHSTIGFVARHLVASKVRGRFTEFAGQVTIGESAEVSSVVGTVQAASITTDNEMRDGHLRTADFLEAETYPTLSLRSTKVTPKGEDRYEVLVDLTIKGVTKSVPFDLEYLGSGPGLAPGVIVAGFEARGEVDRRDFGITFEGTLENGSLVVGHKGGPRARRRGRGHAARRRQRVAAQPVEAPGADGPRRLARYDGRVREESGGRGVISTLGLAGALATIISVWWFALRPRRRRREP